MRAKTAPFITPRTRTAQVGGAVPWDPVLPPEIPLEVTRSVWKRGFRLGPQSSPPKSRGKRGRTLTPRVTSPPTGLGTPTPIRLRVGFPGWRCTNRKSTRGPPPPCYRGAISLDQHLTNHQHELTKTFWVPRGLGARGAFGRFGDLVLSSRIRTSRNKCLAWR